VGLIQDPGRLGVPLPFDSLGLGVGFGKDRVALALGLTLQDLILRFSFSPEPVSHLLALASDQVEDGGSDLDRVIEPAEADVEHVDP
jgi:hypothetical protein